MGVGAAAFVFSKEEYTWALGVALKGILFIFERAAADTQKAESEKKIERSREIDREEKKRKESAEYRERGRERELEIWVFIFTPILKID